MQVNKISSLSHAIKLDAEVFHGTQIELSRQVCGSNQGLRHKIAQFRGSALHPDELVALQQVSGGRHTIQEMARLLGGVFVPISTCADTSNELYNIYISLGLLHSTMREACADGVISVHERIDLEQKAQWTVSAIFAWLMANFNTFGAYENV